MNKFNLSKGLLDTVSGIVTSSKQQQAEQTTQFSAAMREKAKIDTIKPLTAEQLAAVPKREQKDLALHNAIRNIAVESAKAAAEEQQTAEGRINSMYRTSGGRGRALTEGKAHTVPKTEKEKSLAALAEPKNKITHKDVMVGRGVIAKEEAEQPVEEGWDDMLKDVASRNGPQPNGGSGVKQGTRYGGGKQKKDTEEKKEKSEANEEVVDEMMMSSSSTKSSVKVKPGTKDNVGNGLAQQKFTNYIAQRRAENEKNKPQNEEVESIDETSQEYRDAMAAHDSAGREYRLGLAKGRMQQRAAQPKTMGQKIKKDIVKPLIKLAKGDVKGALGESERIEEKNMDTPGNGYEHQCAIHVKHSKLGEGKTLFSQHAQPDAEGNIAWYDVMFEHGIEKKVPTADMEILVSESHMNHKKKK